MRIENSDPRLRTGCGKPSLSRRWVVVVLQLTRTPISTAASNCLPSHSCGRCGLPLDPIGPMLSRGYRQETRLLSGRTYVHAHGTQ